MGRTASILLTEDEVLAMEDGLRLLYRPITVHWDGQFGKFLEPRQQTLVGWEEDDLVHLMRDTGKTHEGSDRPVVVKVSTRVLRRITDEAVYPANYHVKYDNLDPGEECWAIALGHEVGG